MTDSTAPYTPLRPSEQVTLAFPTLVTPLKIPQLDSSVHTATASAFNTPHNSPRCAREANASSSTTLTWTPSMEGIDIYIPPYSTMDKNLSLQPNISERKHRQNEPTPTISQKEYKRRTENVLCNTELSELEQEGEVMRLLALRRNSTREANKRHRVVSSMD